MEDRLELIKEYHAKGYGCSHGDREWMIGEIERLRALIEAMQPHMPFAGVEPWEPNDDLFEHFWHGYPRRNGAKVGKAAAKKQWAKLKLSERVGAVDGVIAYTTAKNGYPEDAERYLRHKRWIGLEVETEGDHDQRIAEGAIEMAESWAEGR